MLVIMYTTRNSWMLLSLFFLLLVPGCWQESVQQKEKKLLYVINLLDKEWYTDCHIKGSEHVPFDQLTSFVSTLPKDTELIVYCSNYFCTASRTAYQQLVAAGFTQVYAYEGGMAEWYQLGYPVEGTCTQEYLKKVVSQPAVEDDNSSKIRTISAEELYKKLYGTAA